ncbi:hypothetical protein [Streptococcus pluranimalium]|uniref:hypothetical protein n=1 Tax=Streptococcus pluranimalium TaxID=82348 RepID=UPI0039FBF2E0
MKEYITVATNENQFDNLYFVARNYDEAFTKAESVLTTHGYPLWCDENGYTFYDYDVEEVGDERVEE